MTNVSVDLLTVAKKTTIRLLDATTTWDSTTSYSATVPAGKRWFLQHAYVWRTQVSTYYLYIQDSGTDVITELASATAAATGVAWPMGTAVLRSLNLAGVYLDAGEILNFTFGVAQDASAFLTFTYLEVDI